MLTHIRRNNIEKILFHSLFLCINHGARQDTFGIY